jgi:hypothetical protein
VTSTLDSSGDPGLAQVESFAPPVGEDHQPIINPVHWESVRSIMPRAFSALSPQSDPSGKKALKSIRESLGMPETARDALAKQIDETLKVKIADGYR